MTHAPDSGEIIEVNFEKSETQETVKKLVLVMSPKAFNETFGLAWVSPITFIKSRHLFQINLPDEMETFGTVKIEQLMTIDWKERGGRLVETVPAAFLKRCQTVAGRILGF